jgi:hypothetical protein
MNENDTAFITDTGWKPEWPVLYCDECGTATYDYDNVIVPALPVAVSNARKGEEAILCNGCADQILGNGSWNSWEAGLTATPVATPLLAKPVAIPRTRLVCDECGFYAEACFDVDAVGRFLNEHARHVASVEPVHYAPVIERRKNAGIRRHPAATPFYYPSR